MNNNGQGTRTMIEVPELGRAYLISMPFSDEEYFHIKLPFENRAEYNKWRTTFDQVMEIVNKGVEEIHDFYHDEIEELKTNYEER
jgi:hypothetical protein